MTGSREECLEVLTSIYDDLGSIESMKDETQMDAVLNDMHGSNPDLFDEEFIKRYKQQVFNSKASSLEDILDILFGSNVEIKDFRSWIEYLDTDEPGWYSSPLSVQSSFDDVREVLLDAHGQDFVDVIEALLKSNEKYASSGTFSKVVEETYEAKINPPAETIEEVQDEAVNEEPKTESMETDKRSIESTDVKTEKEKGLAKTIETKKAPKEEPKKVIEIKKAPKRSEESADVPKKSFSDYTRFEKARIVGARALQISYGAPVLVDYPEDMLDPIDIALLEFDQGLIPISVVRN